MILRVAILITLLHASARADDDTHRQAGVVLTTLGIAAMVAASALYVGSAAGSFHDDELGPQPDNFGASVAAPMVYAASEVLLTAGMPLLLANGDGRPHRRRMVGGAVLTCAGVSAMVAGIVVAVVPPNATLNNPAANDYQPGYTADGRGWAGMGVTVMGNAIFAIGLPLLVEGFGSKRLQARNGMLVF
jgi:hypothetical protein